MGQWIDEMYRYEEKKELDAIKEQSKQLKSNTMSNKKSVVKHVQSAGTWNGMFKFDIDFDNGDTGTCFCKEESSVQKNFPIGKEVEYEFTPMGKGHKVKAVYNASTGGNGGNGGNGGFKSFAKSPEEQSRIARMNALTNAVNWAVSKDSATELDVLTIASAFENFIMSGLNTSTTSATNNTEDIPF
jgi:hypothetical protein